MKTSLFRFCGVLLLAAMLAPVCVHARKNPKNPKNNMRLLYWNIQNGMWSGQGDNYDKFVEWVRAYDPDVCVWCEAQSIYKTGTADKMDVADRYLDVYKRQTRVTTPSKARPRSSSANWSAIWSGSLCRSRSRWLPR